MITFIRYLILSVIVSALLQITLHEIGHMAGGLLTGWKLLHIQLYHFLITKDDKFKIKRVDSSAFQCIMYPAHDNSNPLLYSIMGCYMNLLTAVLALITLLLFRHVVVMIGSISFFIFGIIQLFVNYIPSTRRICNDGACYRILKCDETSRHSHNMQLLTAKKLREGYSYKEHASNMVCLNSNYAGNDITAYHAVLEYYYYLDQQEYEMARKALSKIDKGAKISPNVMDLVVWEKFYLEMLENLMSRGKTVPATKEYGTDRMNYVNKHKSKVDIHTYRVITMWKVYESYLKDDYENAFMILKEAEERMAKISCVYEGEKTYNIKQLKRLQYLLGEIETTSCIQKQITCCTKGIHNV